MLVYTLARSVREVRLVGGLIYTSTYYQSLTEPNLSFFSALTTVHHVLLPFALIIGKGLYEIHGKYISEPHQHL
jgi:uncharacterized membrane protein